MSGDSEDYSTWRLQTDGGIKYRFLGSSGDFTSEQGSIQWRALFRAEDLMDVLRELFPPAPIVGGISHPRYGTMPGLVGVGALKFTYRTWNGDKPGDPFGADSAAPIGTYSGFIEGTVTYGNVNAKGPDPADPRTFLEINSKVSGEYIHIAPEGTKSQPDENPVSSNDYNPETSPILDEQTGELRDDPSDVPSELKTPSPESRPIRTPALSSTILVPKTEWTIKWKAIPQRHFRDVLIHRLRLCNGRVNSKPVPFLYGSKPETLLFAGFDYSESYTWREGAVDSPPIDVSISLIEKSVIWKGTTIGHNHAYMPNKGWERIWIRDNEFPYNHIDMNFLFKI